nr:helix-turn-helix transcriptional regulator [Bacteroidota bacterium]
MDDLQERIALIQSTKGMTNAQFAERIGVQPSSISHLLSGRNKPSLDVILKILKRFPELRNEWLLFGRGAMTKDYSMDLFGAETSPEPHVSKTKTENEMPLDWQMDSSKKTADPLEVKSDKKSPEPLDRTKERADYKKPAKIPVPSKGSTEDKPIEKIVIFYSDRTFREYWPEN